MNRFNIVIRSISRKKWWSVQWKEEHNIINNKSFNLETWLDYWLIYVDKKQHMDTGITKQSNRRFWIALKKVWNHEWCQNFWVLLQGFNADILLVCFKKVPTFCKDRKCYPLNIAHSKIIGAHTADRKNTCTTYKISCYLQGYSFTSQVVRRISEPSIDFFQLPSFFTAELPPDNLTCLGTQQMQRKAVDTDGGLFDIVNGNRSSVPPASWNFQTRKCSGNTAELFPGFLFLNTNNPKNRKKKRQTSGQKHLQNLVNWIYQTCVSLSHITKLLHFRHPIFGGMWIPFTGIHRQHHLYIYIYVCAKWRI